MKVRTKFMLAIFVILLPGAALMMSWLYYSSGRNASHQAVEESSALSNSIHEAVYVLMGTGQQDHLDEYLKSARKISSVYGLWVVRSAALEKELGVKNSAHIKDDE